MKIAIIEDDFYSASFLEAEIKNIIFDVEVVAKIDSVKRAVSFFRSLSYVDLVFMDIELRDGHSLSIFEQCEVKAPVIFVTGHNSFMEEAFKKNGIEYILKPIDPQRLVAAINKYKKLKKQMSSELVDIIRQSGVKRNKKSIITGKRGTEFCILKTEEIAFLFTENYIVFAVDQEGKKYIIEIANLSDLMDDLEDTMFFRANRKIVININFIQRYKIMDRVKLQIEMKIPTPNPVLIGQETAREFKKWVKRL